MKKASLILALMAVCGNAYSQDKVLSLSPTKIVAEQYKLDMKEDSILVGDKDATYFVPKVELNKWNEDKITIEYSGADLSKSTVVSDNVKATSEKENVVMYKIDDDLFEFEIILNEKPSKNTWSFAITGHEDFDFFYQPPLTQQEIDDGYERPENVIGSYAVYHKTKKDNQYKTGKAFHIYRPKLIDADKNEKWATLGYSNGILTITADAKWLETAKYPVVVDPTLGYTSVGASWGNGHDSLKAGIYTASENGTISSIYYYGKTQFGTNRFAGGVYSDSSTQPDSLLAESSSYAGNNSTTGAWKSVSISQEIVNGTSYWVVVSMDYYDGASHQVAYDTGGTSGNYVTKANDFSADRFPDSFDSHTDTTLIYSVYADYTASATRNRMIRIY